MQAQPKGDEKSQEPIYLSVRAELYEVDDAFYRNLSRAKRLSLADLEELERELITPNAPKGRQPERGSLFARLDKQQRLKAGKETYLSVGKEGAVLDVRRAFTCLSSPEQLRQGRKDPQTIQEGFSLRAQLTITADRRFVRARFIEKSLEVEATEKVNLGLDDKGNAIVGEVALLREGRLSQVRDIPDGGSLLLPLQYRPRVTRNNDRWLVVVVVPRIHIEEEEQVIRGQLPK